MSKVLVKTGDVSGFFERAKLAAQKADRGDSFEDKLTPKRDGACSPIACVLRMAAMVKRCGRGCKPPSGARGFWIKMEPNSEFAF